jgi:hypothetical protein
MKKKKTTKPEPKLPESYTIELVKQDLETLINFLAITSQTYERLALDSAAAKDEKSFAVFQARWKLASLFAHKFGAFYGVGEPTSRELN